MKRYRVKTSYPHPGTPRNVGYEFDTTRDIECMDYSDQVALQAGFLEEVRTSTVVEELGNYLSVQRDMCKDSRECDLLAQSILTYLRSKMPASLIKTDAWGDGYNYALREVLREVFGEMYCKEDSK